MKKPTFNLRDNDLLYSGILFILGSLAYLLFIKRLGFYGDDWYIIFDAHTQGPAFLQQVFSSDRPARAIVLGYAYKLFGDEIIYYHLSAFLFRYAGAMAFYWTLNLVWNRNKIPHFLMALFFLVFPGFNMQFQPVDYQSQICSLGLAMVSIALTVKAVKIRSSQVIRLALLIISTVIGWFYLALVEYFIGMEFLRLLFVVCMVWQEGGGTLKERIWKPLVRWLPYGLIPAGFLVWRVFFFVSTRAATDVSVQLGAFTESPLRVGMQWMANGLYGAFNTIIAAWVVPFYNNVVMGGFRLRDSLQILAVGAGAVIIMVLGLWGSRVETQEEQVRLRWIRQVMWGGFGAVLVGIIPIIITNRTVDFENSRYTLAGAPGAVMMLVAGIQLLNSRQLRAVVVGLLVFLSVSTQVGIAKNLAYQADSLRDFWWQVSWRAPSIEAGTNMVVSYSKMEAPENYVIWGPANLIYYPEKQDTLPIQISLPASILSRETVLGIIGNGVGRDKNQRGNYVEEDFSSSLILTQPSSDSCVRIIDGSMPELSPFDRYEVMLTAPYSMIGNVNLTDSSPVLPRNIFGDEPDHGWCYYYQKAALASQMGDWSSVIALGEEAKSKELKPSDIIEWMPFLRAYVASGNIEALKPYPGIMSISEFIFGQSCQILKRTASETRPDDIVLMEFIQTNYCSMP